MIEIIKLAIQHRGFSLVNVLQPCVSFNKINNYQYYQKRVYFLANEYQKNNFELAMKKVVEVNKEKFPLGVIYQVEKPTFTDQLPQIKKEVLIEKDRFTDFSSLVKEFT